MSQSRSIPKKRAQALGPLTLNIPSLSRESSRNTDRQESFGGLEDCKKNTKNPRSRSRIESVKKILRKAESPIPLELESFRSGFSGDGSLSERLGIPTLQDLGLGHISPTRLSADDSSYFDIMNRLINDDYPDTSNESPQRAHSQNRLSWCNTKLDEFFKIHRENVKIISKTPQEQKKKILDEMSESCSDDGIPIWERKGKFPIRNYQREMLNMIKEILDVIETLMRVNDIRESGILLLKLKLLLDSFNEEFLKEHKQARVLKIRTYYNLFRYSYNKKKYSKAMNFLGKIYRDCNYFINDKHVFKEVIKVLLYSS